MGDSRWHGAVTILGLITFTLFNTAQSNTFIEIGQGNNSTAVDAGADGDNELTNLMRHCPNNSFIAGFSARFNEEDTKLTAIRFYCTRQHVLSELPQHHDDHDHGQGGHRKRKIKDVFDVEIQTDPTGIWNKELYCQNGVVTGLQINLITTNRATDPASDGFASDLRMLCSDGQFLQYEDQPSDGDEYWSDEIGKCREKQAACGFQSSFSTSSGPGSVRIECCDVPDPSTTCKPKKNWHRATHCDNPISSTNKTCSYGKRVGMSYAGKEPEVQIYEDLGFRLDSAGSNLQDKMREVSFGALADNDGNVAAQNWVPEPPETEAEEISAMPGFSTTVYQLIGHCGFYKIRFNSFKADSVEMEVNDDEEEDVDKAKLIKEKEEKVLQGWMKEHNLKYEDLYELELMQADAAAAPWDPDEEWADGDNFGDNDWNADANKKTEDNEVPAAAAAAIVPAFVPDEPEPVPMPEPEKSKQDSDSNEEDDWSEEDWDFDFPEPEPKVNNVPIQNSEKINSVSNPREFLVDIPLSPANLAKPPAPASAAAAAPTHQQHVHGSKSANLQDPALVDGKDQGPDNFFEDSWDDDFFKENLQEKSAGNSAAAQDNRRDFSALNPDDDVEDLSNQNGGHHSRNQQQQMASGLDAGGDEDDLLGGGDNNHHQHVHDQDQHGGHVNEGERSGGADTESGSSPAPEPAKVNNAILGYIVGGMVIAVCIIVIIIFVLEKRKPRSRGSDPVKRQEYASNLEPRLLTGDDKPSDRRITIEEEKEAA